MAGHSRAGEGHFFGGTAFLFCRTSGFGVSPTERYTLRKAHRLPETGLPASCRLDRNCPYLISNPAPEYALSRNSWISFFYISDFCKLPGLSLLTLCLYSLFGDFFFHFLKVKNQKAMPTYNDFIQSFKLGTIQLFGIFLPGLLLLLFTVFGLVIPLFLFLFLLEVQDIIMCSAILDANQGLNKAYF